MIIKSKMHKHILKKKLHKNTKTLHVFYFLSKICFFIFERLGYIQIKHLMN
jgi:hypothetical protein